MQNLPDFSTVGPDFERLKENLGGWNWDTFAQSVLSSTSSEVQGRESNK